MAAFPRYKIFSMGLSNRFFNLKPEVILTYDVIDRETRSCGR